MRHEATLRALNGRSANVCNGSEADTVGMSISLSYRRSSMGNTRPARRSGRRSFKLSYSPTPGHFVTLAHSFLMRSMCHPCQRVSPR